MLLAFLAGVGVGLALVGAVIAHVAGTEPAPNVDKVKMSEQVTTITNEEERDDP
jgi:hypothetical protein